MAPTSKSVVRAGRNKPAASAALAERLILVIAEDSRVLDADVPPLCGNDSRRDSAAEAKGIAHGDHPLADLRLCVVEADVGEVGWAGNLQQREIGFRGRARSPWHRTSCRRR
jgi:hypothetical protein